MDREMEFQELCDYMLYSPVWQMKERLFAEAFPEAADRVRFFSDYVDRLLREYRKAGKSVGDLHDLRVRQLAIDWWFGMIPRSLLNGNRALDS